MEGFGFTHRYNSVKRFVRGLKVREPERYDVLESPIGEEAQVDFGQGALTLYRPGKYRRPWLFCMTLKYSRKAFRKVIWKADQESWVRLHEEAFRAFGGSVRYVVLDNLKQGVIKPDLYDPQYNPLYSALLAHYHCAPDVARVADPNRKGTVESTIQHTQNTALKGRRFNCVEDQNNWLSHWEERWAAPRIHGRAKRQVLQMYLEEKPHLQPLPLEPFRLFRQETRTVEDDGLIQVYSSYYAALPAPLYSEVIVRVYEREVEIFDQRMQLLRRHERSTQKGSLLLEPGDGIFNPSRETARLIGKVSKIGPHCRRLAQEIFAHLGRPGQRAIYGMTNLTRHHSALDIERASQKVMELSQPSYQALKRILKHYSQQSEATAAAGKPALIQHGEHVREIHAYQQFWDEYSQQAYLPAADPSSEPTHHDRRK